MDMNWERKTCRNWKATSQITVVLFPRCPTCVGLAYCPGPESPLSYWINHWEACEHFNHFYFWKLWIAISPDWNGDVESVPTENGADAAMDRNPAVLSLATWVWPLGIPSLSAFQPSPKSLFSITTSVKNTYFPLIIITRYVRSIFIKYRQCVKYCSIELRPHFLLSFCPLWLGCQFCHQL